MSTLVISAQKSGLNDVTALHRFLRAELRETFRSVRQNVTTGTISITCMVAPDSSEREELNRRVGELLLLYENPRKDIARPGLHYPRVNTNELDAFDAENGVVKVTCSILDLNGHRITNLPVPSAGGDAVNKNYVDGIRARAGLSKRLSEGDTFALDVNLDEASLELDVENNQIRLAAAGVGRGLSGGSGGLLTVLPTLEHVVKLGQLESLSVEGMIVAKAGVEVPEFPSSASDATSRTYVDGLVFDSLMNSYGAGLSSSSGQSGNVTLNVQVDGRSVDISDQGQLRVSPTFIGYGLGVGSNGMLAVNSALPELRSVGVLDDLGVAGEVLTRTLKVREDALIAGDLTVETALSAKSGIDVNARRITSLAEPSDATDAATKAYTDSLVALSGRGLQKVGNIFSVVVDDVSLEIHQDGYIRTASSGFGAGLTGGSGAVVSVVTSLPHVTEVGELTHLNVTGRSRFSDMVEFDNDVDVGGKVKISDDVQIDEDLSVLGHSVHQSMEIHGDLDCNGKLDMKANRVVNMALPTAGSDGATRGYVDSLIVTAGGGLVKNGNQVSAVVDGTSVELGEDSGGGTIRVGSWIAGTGLSGGSGEPLSINAAQPGITSVGMLSSLAVNGVITAYSGVNNNNARVTNVGWPTTSSDGTPKSYVDSTRPTPGTGLRHGQGSTDLEVVVDESSLEIEGNAVRISRSAVGVGLEGGSGTPIVVIPEQRQVTAVGDLVNLSVIGNTVFHADADVEESTRAPNRFLGAVSVAKRLFVGGTLSVEADVVTEGALCFGEQVVLRTGSNANADSSTLEVRSPTERPVKIRLSDNMEFTASPSGGSLSTSEQLLINGTVRIGADGAMSVTGDFPSTSPVTGAVVITTGGLGVEGAVHVRGVGHFHSGADCNGSRLVNVADPVDAKDAANRQYVDSVVQGLSVKQSVVVASVTTEDLAVLQAGHEVDGHVLSAGERVLLKSQTDPVENGIYVVGSSGPPSRADDFDDGSAAPGAFVFVSKGNVNASSGWVTSVNGSLTQVGSAAVNFSQFSALGQVSAGHGLIKEGNVLNVKPDDVSVEVVDDAIRIKSSGFGRGLSGGSGTPITVNENLGHVTGVGEISSGSWCGNTVQVRYGGTGASSFPPGRILFGTNADPIGHHIDFSYSVAERKLYLPSLRADGECIFGAGLTTPGPPSSTHSVTNKEYVDSLIPHAGEGLRRIDSMNGSPVLLTVERELPHVISVGNLVDLTVDGQIISGSLSTGGATFNSSVTVTGNITVSDPILARHVTHKGYVDGLVVTAGTGLRKVGTTLMVEPVQSTITNLGVLQGLTSSGDVHILSPTQSNDMVTGALRLEGGMGVRGNINIGGSGTFKGQVSAPLIPLQPEHVTSKSYVDSLVSLPGVGLSKSGNTFKVDSDLTHVLSVGSLRQLTVVGGTSLNTLTVTGIVVCQSTVESNDTAAGALVVSGGVAVSKNLNVGGTLGVSTSKLVASGNTVALANLGGENMDFALYNGTSTLSGLGFRSSIRLFTFGGPTSGDSETLSLTAGSDYVSSLKWTTAGTRNTTTMPRSLTIGAVNDEPPSVIINSSGQTTSMIVSGSVDVRGGGPSTFAGGVDTPGGVGCGVLKLPGNVTLTASLGNYALRLPTSAPGAGNNTLVIDSNGNSNFRPLPVTYNHNLNGILAVKMHSFTVITSNGTARAILTADGTISGSALFGSVLSYTATATANTTNAVQSPLCSLKSISTDLKTIVFNVVVGSSGFSSTAQFAPNGIPVNIFVVGT